MPETSNFAVGNNFYIYANIEGGFEKDILAPFDKAVAEMSKIDEAARCPIIFWILSDGGWHNHVYELIARFEIAKRLGVTVYTAVPSIAGSAAVSIFIAGHRRFIGRNASLIIHNPRLQVDVLSPIEVERYLEKSHFTYKAFYGLFQKYTKLDNIMSLVRDGDYILSGDCDIINNGLADATLEDEIPL